MRLARAEDLVGLFNLEIVKSRVTVSMLDYSEERVRPLHLVSLWAKVGSGRRATGGEDSRRASYLGEFQVSKLGYEQGHSRRVHVQRGR